jgi:hypothetical protein
MRFLVIIAAALLVLPAAHACGVSAKAASVEYTAAKKKKPAKVVRKAAKPKVEYMRIAP